MNGYDLIDPSQVRHEGAISALQPTATSAIKASYRQPHTSK